MMSNEIDTMTPDRTLDIEPLLEPITSESPAGESLRYDGTFDAIREARREDDPTLPQGVWKTELKKADWKEVERLCAEALRGKTKDLQIAAWLTESWIHRHRMNGAASGFRLLEGLCASFWESIFPPVENDDLDPRLSPLEWMNDRLPIVLKSVPLSESSRPEDALTWTDWESALFRETHREGVTKTEAADEDGDGALPSRRSELMEKVHATSTEFYGMLQRSVHDAHEALTGLDTTLHELCGDREAPSLGKLRDTVEEIEHFVGRILKERDVMEEESRAPMAEVFPGTGEAPQTAESTPETEGSVPGKISSRAEAYRALAAAADYLVAIEPHSPAPYLVRRAIKWGRMSLAELLRELLRDNADLPTVYSLLGIRDADTFKD